MRLEHILERIALISDAANTERPSLVTGNLFIGGALAARSMYTLQHLGITHILCLCSNEIGQSDSQYLDVFEYKNFSVRTFFIFPRKLLWTLENLRFYLPSTTSMIAYQVLMASVELSIMMFI